MVFCMLNLTGFDSLSVLNSISRMKTFRLFLIFLLMAQSSWLKAQFGISGKIIDAETILVVYFFARAEFAVRNLRHAVFKLTETYV